MVPHSAWRNYAVQMIRSFRCPDTERLAQGWVVPQFQAFERVARRKLRQLEIAGRLDDLRIPPGNRLEALRGDRAGQHSIRINDHSASASSGRMQGLKPLNLSTTTDACHEPPHTDHSR